MLMNQHHTDAAHHPATLPFFHGAALGSDLIPPIPLPVINWGTRPTTYTASDQEAMVWWSCLVTHLRGLALLYEDLEDPKQVARLKRMIGIATDLLSPYPPVVVAQMLNDSRALAKDAVAALGEDPGAGADASWLGQCAAALFVIQGAYTKAGCPLGTRTRLNNLQQLLKGAITCALPEAAAYPLLNLDQLLEGGES